MGQFHHVRYVVVVLLAIGLFIMIVIERHLPLTILKLEENFRLSVEEMSAKFETEKSNMDWPFYQSKMQTFEKSIEILRDEYITKIESFARGIQSFQYTSYISMLLSANLILKWDSKVMLAIGVGGMSFCHLLIPAILPLANALFIILCIFEGFFLGLIIPFFITVMSFWTPIMENTTLISISLLGYYLAMALSRTIFLASANLDVPFYVFGVLGLCWTVLWSILAKAKPSDDPKMTQTELEYILSNGNEGGITTLTNYIRKRIFYTKSTLSILVVILCNVFNFVIVALMMAFKRSNKMLDNTILYPHLVAIFVIVAIAYITDYLRQKYCITKIRKTVICTGLLCSAIIMPFITIIYPENFTFYSVLFGLFIIFQAIILTSCFVNLVDVMHHAAGYTLGVFLGIASLITAVIAVVVNLTNGHVIFWVFAAFNIVGCLTYAICGSAKREIWVMNNINYEILTANETSNAPRAPSNA